MEIFPSELVAVVMGTVCLVVVLAFTITAFDINNLRLTSGHHGQHWLAKAVSTVALTVFLYGKGLDLFTLIFNHHHRLPASEAASNIGLAMLGVWLIVRRPFRGSASDVCKSCPLHQELLALTRRECAEKDS